MERISGGCGFVNVTVCVKLPTFPASNKQYILKDLSQQTAARRGFGRLTTTQIKPPIFISAKKTYYSAKPTDQQRQSLMTMHEQCLLYNKQCLLFHHYVTLVARFYWQILVTNCCNVHCTSDALFLIFSKRINHERVFRLVLFAYRATCRRILDVDIRLGLQ